jgi:hypothetical protein
MNLRTSPLIVLQLRNKELVPSICVIEVLSKEIYEPHRRRGYGTRVLKYKFLVAAFKSQKHDLWPHNLQHKPLYM